MEFLALLGDVNSPQMRQKLKGHSPDPFDGTPKPHSHTSPIARFRTENPIPSIPTSAPVAQAVLHGWCSLMSDSINSPIHHHTVPNSDTLIFAGGGCWKNREPQRLGDFPDKVTIENGLLDIAYNIALDSSRRLIYIVDNRRIKSFVYQNDKDKYLYSQCTSGCSGPLAVIDNGARILHASKGGVDVWNTDALPTHCPDGTKQIVKGKIGIEDTWRDDIDEVKTSTGAPRDMSINFADATLKVGNWHIPSQWSTRGTLKALCFPTNTQPSVLQMDFENGGRAAARYLGHAGEIFTITSSPDDTNTFLTTSGDGIVHLFDVREPLPNVSFGVGNQSEHVFTALYIRVEGIQSYFQAELEASRSKYGTFVFLIWPMSLRQAKIRYDDDGINDGQVLPGADPDVAVSEGEKKNKEADRESDEEDKDDDEDYAYDAGDHVLLRYKFGLDADLIIIPAFGMARLDNGSYW
ncbi:hypothetical protein GYMLUDRAFT_1028494 [Collybiopsis luxurians FD-317 M1]|uniref:Uncharacterized protein n=1 Tax=Collybiopsis luxurians FD-317 M1 TaxID=944289 RepID=A0A0D0C4I1_9AGAR|nr:hypothetical protein GYMLUDRAFT_1028494 [Collybiopsis luxurians FD-317 M1]